jgi:hypothetical protein
MNAPPTAEMFRVMCEAKAEALAQGQDARAAVLYARIKLAEWRREWERKQAGGAK